MMYNMPPDTREKEKIVGGILDLPQVLWLGGGFVIYIILIISLFRFLSFFIIFLGIGFPIVGAIMAFKKKENMSYPRYLLLRNRYKRKIKYYVNAGFHDDWDI